MPRFAQPAPDRDARKAIEERARAAANPVAPAQKGRWPFSASPTSAESQKSDAPVLQAKPAETQPIPPQ